MKRIKTVLRVLLLAIPISIGIFITWLMGDSRQMLILWALLKNGCDRNGGVIQ